MEGLGFLLATNPPTCPTCGLIATEGLLWHKCEDPGPQPDPREA